MQKKRRGAFGVGEENPRDLPPIESPHEVPEHSTTGVTASLLGGRRFDCCGPDKFSADPASPQAFSARNDRDHWLFRPFSDPMCLPSYRKGQVYALPVTPVGGSAGNLESF